MNNENFIEKLPPDIRAIIGKTIKRKLPDGRVIKFVVGDVTGDGKIDQEDIKILRMLCQGGMTAEKIFESLSPEQLSACDITGDGYINNDDLMELLKGVINTKPVNSIENKLSNLRKKLK